MVRGTGGTKGDDRPLSANTARDPAASSIRRIPRSSPRTPKAGTTSSFISSRIAGIGHVMSRFCPVVDRMVAVPDAASIASAGMSAAPRRRVDRLSHQPLGRVRPLAEMVKQGRAARWSPLVD